MIKHKHNYCFVDAIYYLTRNSYVIKGEPTVAALMGSFFLSINKLQKELMARKIFLIFDKGPYKKSEIINTYKGDRIFAIDAIAEIEEKLKTETDPTIIRDLEKQLEVQKRNDKLFHIRMECKNELLENGREFGFVSYQHQGFECDDLARFFAKLTSDNNHKTDLPNVIVSSDSDWMSFTDTNCNNYRSTRSPKYFTFTDSKQVIPEKFRDKITPFEYKQLISLYSGNHDNIKPIRIASELNLDEFLQEYLTGELFKDEEFKTIFNALNIEPYYEELKPELEKTLKLGKLSKYEFYKFKDKIGMNIYPSVINSLFNSLDDGSYSEDFTIWQTN